MSEIKEILLKYKTIAMIGVSKDPKKPSAIVMKYMQKYGFKVIPVNPRAKGEKNLGEEVFEKIKLRTDTNPSNFDKCDPAELEDSITSLRGISSRDGILYSVVYRGSKVFFFASFSFFFFRSSSTSTAFRRHL